jgi:ATP-dependent Clp protease ATP-binding subunit ClpB
MSRSKSSGARVLDLEEVWKAEKAALQGTADQGARSSRPSWRWRPRAAPAISRACPSCSTANPGAREAAEQAQAEPESGEPTLLRNKVTEEESPRSSPSWTGIPVSKMLEGERDKLLRMEEALHERVVGQDEAVVPCPTPCVAPAPGSPTRTAQRLVPVPRPDRRRQDRAVQGAGRVLFDTDEAMVRIDMSEFMEKHSVARLIGAPPGYVGYEEGGYLTEAVRRRPYSLLLLDEVEKAHPDVFNILLQVLDDGRLTDGQGRTVDFRNTVIVMTSNLGSDLIQEMAGDENYDAMKERGDGGRGSALPARVHQPGRRDVVFHPLDAGSSRSAPSPISRSATWQGAAGTIATWGSDRRQRRRARPARRGRLRPGLWCPARSSARSSSQLENPLAQEIRKGRGSLSPVGRYRYWWYRLHSPPDSPRAS